MMMRRGMGQTCSGVTANYTFDSNGNAIWTDTTGCLIGSSAGGAPVAGSTPTVTSGFSIPGVTCTPGSSGCTNIAGFGISSTGLMIAGIAVAALLFMGTRR